MNWLDNIDYERCIFLPHSAVIFDFLPWFLKIWEWFLMFFKLSQQKDIVEEIKLITHMSCIQEITNDSKWFLWNTNSQGWILFHMGTHYGFSISVMFSAFISEHYINMISFLASYYECHRKCTVHDSLRSWYHFLIYMQVILYCIDYFSWRL